MIRIFKVKKIKAILIAFSLVVLFGVGAMLSPSANAADVKVALVPGGPHPFFAPWEQAQSFQPTNVRQPQTPKKILISRRMITRCRRNGN